MIYQDTSRQAFAGTKLGETDALIIRAITNAPGGLTSQQIEGIVMRSHQAVSGNITHLVERGLVRDSGRVRKVRSGYNAIVWILGDGTPRPRVRAKWARFKDAFKQGSVGQLMVPVAQIEGIIQQVDRGE